LAAEAPSKRDVGFTSNTGNARRSPTLPRCATNSRSYLSQIEKGVFFASLKIVGKVANPRGKHEKLKATERAAEETEPRRSLRVVRRDQGACALFVDSVRDPIPFPQRRDFLAAPKRVERIGSDAGGVHGPVMVRPGGRLVHCERGLGASQSLGSASRVEEQARVVAANALSERMSVRKLKHLGSTNEQGSLAPVRCKR